MGNSASVLGIYGLPGSGKSTLCRSLQGYFFSSYPGKSLCLELPTSATPSNLNGVISRVFNLNTSATHIDEVISLLKNHQLSRKSIFLAVDNICVESCEIVQRILSYVIGPGSRIVLVAHTLDLLRSTLVVAAKHLVGHEQLPCICDSMPMPGINEEEATNLLLEVTGQGCGTMGLHHPDLMRQKDKVLKVVRMCGFRPIEYSTTELKYLPLVVKRMGAMLTSYEKDIDGWVRDQENFWSSFNDEELKLCRMDVVHMLIFESFKNSLDAPLQLLFLDVALFLQPSQLCRQFDEACIVLGSCMHGKDATLIKKMLRDLKRLCFIDTLGKHEGVVVHDVYVEFAESIQQKGFIDWSYIRDQDIHLDTFRTVELKLEEEKNTPRPVRAMNFEVKQGCETIDLKGFSSLKAVVIRNCGTLVTLRMAGLTSLASLDITGFRELPQLVCYDCDRYYASLQNVRRLNLKSECGKFDGDAADSSAYMGSSIINRVLHGMMKMSNFVPGFMKQPSSLGVAKHMKALQVLRLEDTGMKNLEDMGSCSWPHLQELQVWECFLERFRLGNLPALKKLEFVTRHATFESRGLIKGKRSDEAAGQLVQQQLAEGKNLLMGCPALQDVNIMSDLFKNVELMMPTWRGLRMLSLTNVDSALQLGDVASSACTLEDLNIDLCHKLEKVHFSAGQLPRLTCLTISCCDRIVHVKFGSQALPSLTDLSIHNCKMLVEVEFGIRALSQSLRFCRLVDVSELCVLSGLEELRLLQNLSVACCSMLQQQPNCLCGLVHLRVLSLVQYPSARKLHRALDFKSVGFEGLSSLEVLEIKGGDMISCTAPVNLASLTNLVRLETDGTLQLEGLDGLHRLESFVAFSSYPMSNIEDLETDHQMLELLPAGGLQYIISQSSSSHKSSMRTAVHMDTSNHVQITQPVPLFPHTLHLNISSQHLTRVYLTRLQHLRRLDGIECLHHLQDLNLSECPQLEELSSLHVQQEMRYLVIRDSVKLKAVEGCDRLRNLRQAIFSGCESMEQLPFKDVYALGCTHPLLKYLSFEACRFARGRRELMVEWARVSILLGKASLSQLLWEHKYRIPDSSQEMMDDKEMLEEAIVSCLLSLLLFPLDGDAWQLSDACTILVERLVASKLKKDLIHPASLLALLSILSKEGHIQASIVNVVTTILG